MNLKHKKKTHNNYIQVMNIWRPTKTLEELRKEQKEQKKKDKKKIKGGNMKLNIRESRRTSILQALEFTP